MKLLLIIVPLLSMLSCAHVAAPSREQILRTEIRSSLYNNIKNILIETNAVDLKECNCMAAFNRDLLSEPDGSARYMLDKKVGEQARKLGTKDSISVFVIGAGLLLNELTAIANILAQKKNAKIYLTDWAYVFYGEENFQEKALAWGKNPDALPEGYKNFYFWQWARKKVKDWPFIPFFEQHHRAIDQFKTALMGLDKIYGTTSTVEIIKPVADSVFNLPPIDLILSIDAFTDLPNLTKILLYEFKLAKNPIRFISLNKTQPLGGFWHSSGGKKIEESEKKGVLIESYDVSSIKNRGSYALIEHIELLPSAEQIERLQKMKAKSQRDSAQSPLEGFEG